MNRVYNMDFQWKFHRGDVDGFSRKKSSLASKARGQAGPAGIFYDDSTWRQVDVPHDFFAESPFDPTQLRSHGYREACNGWYRKTFQLDPSLEGKHLLLCFDGTSVNAEFYFNGSLMERSFSAYTESVFEITDRAYFGAHVNTLAVYIKGQEKEGWWYEGAGIYRHVRLYVKDRLHIAHNGIWAKPVLQPGTDDIWTVRLETTAENSDCTGTRTASAVAELFDGETLLARSESAATDCSCCSQAVIRQEWTVTRPERWDVEKPKLYTLRVQLKEQGAVVDEDSVRIGFRTFYVDKDRGFFLNGRRLLIKGTCNHQDHAGVGVAVPDSVQYYRIKRLKEMGTNAYRSAHNLPAREILDACDELGLIVMDENRRFEARKEVLQYLETMVKRDRNHPSVVFYSLFNEEPLQNTREGANIYRRMRACVRQLDDTRLITGAIDGNLEGAGLEMDITGINYHLGDIERLRAFHPEQPIFGSENNSAVTTRGCYHTDAEQHALSNYDEEAVPWGNTVRETWDFVKKHPYFAGIFVWTGFDYRGEPTPFSWPSVSSQFGIMDTCGFPKDSFYYNKACFTDAPMVQLLPHWNWRSGDRVRVAAVTNCQEAELFLNGSSLGRKPAGPCAKAEWLVDFVPGEIAVKAYRNGSCAAQAKQVTAGKPVKVKILPADPKIKNDGQDTAILNICVVDAEGRTVPDAANPIHLEVLGDGLFRGCGNGDPNSHESDTLPQRQLFAGWCQMLVTSRRNAKAIQVIASSPGLESAMLSLEVEYVEPQPCILSSPNYDISGFEKYIVTQERPDPLQKIDSSNRELFYPWEFYDSSYRADYYSGWSIFRAPVTAKETGAYTLQFPKLYVDAMEVYWDGQRVLTVDSPLYHGRAECTVFARSGEATELRILTYVKNATCLGGGISEAVRLIPVP